jgi:GNAT superfamily N-acetyltransferase
VTELLFRPAVAEDLPAIVALLADDALGASREAPGDPAYAAAFAAMEADPNEHPIVVERDGRIAGFMQIGLTPGLSRRGATRGVIESVRVASDLRGAGLGAAMIRWAVEFCRARGCALVQLTSDKSRTDAHRFYAGLGFANSHEGFKLELR